MNKHCAFTICTRSYLGLANALRSSFLNYNEDFDFYVIFADYVEEDDYPEYVLSAKDVMNLDDKKFYEMAFKYNVTEFCTSIKPFGHLFFFARGYDSAFYFDPDILFYSRFNEIFDECFSVYLTPHIVNMSTTIENDWGQEQFLKYGTFNCGFAGFRNNEIGNKIALWWAEQLKDKAFADSDAGLYTDQKWMDIIPSLIDLKEIYVIRNLGCDFAPWNYSERKCVLRNGVFYAQDRENDTHENLMCFVHYSAYDYKLLLEKNEICSKYTLTHYEDTDQLVYYYADELNRCNTLSYFDIPYLFSKYENGFMVTTFHRRLYRGLINSGKEITNPFECGAESFFSIMKKAKFLSKTDSSKIGKGGVKNYQGKSDKVDKLFKMAFNLLGIDRYTLMLRKLGKNVRIENNLFLLNK